MKDWAATQTSPRRKRPPEDDLFVLCEISPEPSSGKQWQQQQGLLLLLPFSTFSKVGELENMEN